jgi:hypothetical protein
MNIGTKYGIAEIKIENRVGEDGKFADSGKIDISLQNLHNGKNKNYSLQGKKKYLKKKRIIVRAGEYNIRMKNYDNQIQTGLIVKPFKVLPKSEVTLKLPRFVSKPVAFNVMICDDKTGKEISFANISFKDENSDWQKYLPETTLYNGRKYEFKAEAQGYLPSFSYKVDFPFWIHSSNLKIKLSQEKTLISFDIPPVALDIKVNGKNFWNTTQTEQYVEKVFLPKKGEEKKIYCTPGNYSLLFVNKKESIRIEKNITVPKNDKELRISFEKDGGDELCAVLKVLKMEKVKENN